ncbi:MAG: hypothetical protein IPM84_13305 [Anaerolineae bacterium]|nr:hypothetical protein [Anaerolineae bacterium]
MFKPWAMPLAAPLMPPPVAPTVRAVASMSWRVAAPAVEARPLTASVA